MTKEIPTPKRLSRAETTQQTQSNLLSAATELFREQGYAATTIEHIVNAAGVTRGAFQKRFKTKANAANSVLDEVYKPIIDRLDELSQLPKTTEPTDFNSFVDTTVGWTEEAIRNSAWVRLEFDLATERQHQRRVNPDSFVEDPIRLTRLKTVAAQALTAVASASYVTLREPETIVVGLLSKVVATVNLEQNPRSVAPFVQNLLQSSIEQ